MTRRDRPSAFDKLAALALLAAGLTLILAIVVLPAERKAARLDAEIDAARALAAGYAESLHAGRGEDPQAAAEPSFGAEWVQGETLAIAAAGLRRRIAAVAEAEGAEVRSMQELPTSVEAAFRIVALSVVLEGGFEPLLRTLRRLETEQPLLRVDRLFIRAERGGDRIAAEIDLSGLLAPGRPE